MPVRPAAWVSVSPRCSRAPVAAADRPVQRGSDRGAPRPRAARLEPVRFAPTGHTPLDREFPETATSVVADPVRAATLPGMNEYDVVVIGGGAAGLSAALVLTRARRTGRRGRRRPAAQRPGRAHARLPAPTASRRPSSSPPAGTRSPDTAAHLVAGIVTASPRGADRRRTRASVRGHSRGRAAVLRTRRVLVTTGLRDELPDIPGVRERWGRDLLHCPYCHGYEVRDQPLGVLGGTPEARRARPPRPASGPTTSSLRQRRRRSPPTSASSSSPAPSASSTARSHAWSSTTTT